MTPPLALLPFTYFSPFELSIQHHITDLTLLNKTDHINPPLDASITQAHMSITSRVGWVPDFTPSNPLGTALCLAACLRKDDLCEYPPNLSVLNECETKVNTHKAGVRRETDQLQSTATSRDFPKQYERFDQQHSEVGWHLTQASNLIIHIKKATEDIRSTRSQLNEVTTMADLKAYLEEGPKKMDLSVAQLEHYCPELERSLELCKMSLDDWYAAKEGLAAALTASGSSTSAPT